MMLARDFGAHRISARVEEFRVSDLNRLGQLGMTSAVMPSPLPMFPGFKRICV